jgi:polyisoprenoid-binding protein YceI
MSTFTAGTLDTALKSNHPPLLIDTRLADDFETSHLPGAVNNCVFEVAFLDRMTEIAAEKNTPLCLYGAAETSLESLMAAEKLAAAGYPNITDFRGGLAAWLDAGLPVESQAPPQPLPSVPDGTHPVDLKESRVEWLGRNLLNKHWGHIALKSGSLTFADNQLTAGEFTLDMRRITCDDLKGDPFHDLLVHHLESDDFFDVKNFPEGHFKITSAKPSPGAPFGSQNIHLTGDLTLKGVTGPVDFTASAGLTEDGKAAAQASFPIDRTRWNVLYGSGKFFHRLAGHLVNDEIELQLRIIATPS